MNPSASHSGTLPDYSSVQSIPEMWAIAARTFASVTAVHDPHASPEVKFTYGELYEQFQQFAGGLQALSILAPSESLPPRIGLIADNSPRWLIADQGIMRSGAVDVVRSAQADTEELLFILRDSGAIALVIENLAAFKKLRSGLEDLPLQFVVLLSEEEAAEESLKVFKFSEVLELGKGRTLQPVSQTRDTLATLMYTSGTSGMPKGVMLSHGNLLAQVIAVPEVLILQPGERVLSILPIWHSYERSFENIVFSYGCTQIYTNIRHVKSDLKQYQPHYMVAVPRLWESIYDGIQKQFREQPASKQKLIGFLFQQSQRYIEARRVAQGLDLKKLDPSPLERSLASLQSAALLPFHLLGKKLVYQKVREGMGGAIKYLVSGGGSIADYLEDFFEIVDVQLLGGYGLTETSPITNVRRPSRNLRGADGQPFGDVEIQIVDPESRQPLAIGQQGLVLIRGSQVMQGYFNNPVATQKAIDPQGWFDSGDLGMVTAAKDLIITGRAKDTIVLTNGENIEPQPIENACLRSPYIDQIMLVGQDQKSLGALIVPNREALKQWAVSQNLTLRMPDEVLGNAIESNGAITFDSKPVQELYRQELTREVKNRPGYRADDRVNLFRLLAEPFTLENGMLTQTLKIRRVVVTERYRGMIDEMFT
ncbi:MAG: AMP-binding protein [Drouetiella hepatica Uher 2000/2452]|uniref:AMP-binding protein n=1 Tax=Drouetiella hepatica Uher 2000/2452 TaxID=904376 RepID=A0A951QED1_9CYAN|nr:AMP-binding protein [Drouetiella hepatica Uher 2000/2452]